MSSKLINDLLELSIKGKRARQVGSLYAAMIGSLVLGFVTSVINTRLLGPQGYGDLKFVSTLYQFFATLSTFGIFATGAQILANLRDNDNSRFELAGALVIISTMLSVLFIVVSAVFSFIEPMVFGNKLDVLILIFSPMVSLFIFQVCIESILQGENKIHALSLFRILPAALYVVLVLVLNTILTVDVTVSLAIQLVAGVAVTAFLLVRLGPDFANGRANRKSLWHANMSYGRHVYIGLLSAVATNYFSTFAISYFLDNTQVGFFSLAQTVTLPLGQIPGIVGTTYFKDFAHRDHLPNTVTVVTVGITGVTLLVFVLFIKPLVSLLYTEKFITVASLASTIAVGSALVGVGDYLNRFLGAHGKGRELRNGAVAVGIAQIFGFLFLVKLIGVNGAAITVVVAGAVYCAMMIFYYRKFTQTSDSGGS